MTSEEHLAKVCVFSILANPPDSSERLLKTGKRVGAYTKWELWVNSWGVNRGAF